MVMLAVTTSAIVAHAFIFSLYVVIGDSGGGHGGGDAEVAAYIRYI